MHHASRLRKFRTRPQRGTNLVLFCGDMCGFCGACSKRATRLFAVGINGVTFDHAIERAAIDAEDLSGACAISTSDLEHVKQITTFELVQWWQVFKQR